MRNALAGWGELVEGDPNASRLDRILVYMTIEAGQFTLKDLLGKLTAISLDFEPELLKQSLARLELAFILRRERNTFTYQVPLFWEMLLDDGPSELLAAELKSHASNTRSL